jgi:hypothetical protein
VNRALGVTPPSPVRHRPARANLAVAGGGVGLIAPSAVLLLAHFRSRREQTRRRWRPARIGAVLAMLGAVVVCGPAPVAAAAGTAGFCPDANGVTVVVDFHELGGATTVRCAPGPQSSGIAALRNAGFSVTGTARWGDAFVCRINGKPGPDTEPCINTPPTSAYWSYWYAADGGSWTYSQAGALGRRPLLGGFEGWSFALNKSESTAPPPRVAPRRPAPPPPSSPPTQSPPAQPAPGQPGAGQPAPGQPGAGQPGAGQPGTGAAGAGRLSTAPGSAGAQQPGQTAAPDGTAGKPAGTSAGSQPGDRRMPTSTENPWTGDVAEAAHQGPGSPLGLLLGAVVVALLGAGAAMIGVRRRRASGDP